MEGGAKPSSVLKRDMKDYSSAGVYLLQEMIVL